MCGTPQYVAPEVINEEASDSYGVEVDMWSAGVVLFVLLGGYPPFYDESEPKLFAAIQKGEFAFDDEVWTDISDLAKDLIRKLIEVDPKKRLSARQALHHPWVTGPQAQVDLSGTRQNMENRMRKKLKAKVRSVIAANRMKLLAGAMGAGKMDDTVPEGNEEEEEEEDEDALLREQVATLPLPVASPRAIRSGESTLWCHPPPAFLPLLRCSGPVTPPRAGGISRWLRHPMHGVCQPS